MNFFSVIIILFNIHHFGCNADFIPFLSDFFRFKNVKTIWVVSCKTNHNRMLAKWRKNSMDMISLRPISGESDLSLPPDYDPKEMLGLSIDLSCGSSHVIENLLTKDAVKRRVVVLGWRNGRSKVPLDAISHLLLLGLTDLFFAVPSPNVNNILVYIKNIDLAMIWDDHNGLVALDTNSRPKLSGRIVRGMITLKDERRHETDKLLGVLEEKSWKTVDDNLMKFSFVLHQFLEKIYDFQWQLHLCGSPAIDEVYVLRNGSLDYFMNGSQFGALKAGYVDVGLYPAELLPAALDSFEILPPFTSFRQFFVFRSPITVLEPYVVYSIFSIKVWLVTFCLALLMSMVSTISAQTTKSTVKEDKELTFITNILIAVGALAQQGLERSSEKLSVRICHFFLLFLTLMLFMFYNTGFLIYTLNPTQKEIKSFKQLLHKGFTISAEDTPYNRFQLQGSYSHPSEWFYHNCRTGWGSCRTELDFHNLTVGTEMLKKGNAAYFGYASNIYGVLGDITTDREQSDLRQLPVHKPYLVSTFVRKHFPYKELFTRGLLLLKEAGITFHEDQKWNFKKPDPLMDSYFVIASLYSTSVAFILLFSGVLGSLFLLLLEIFTKQENSAVRLEKVVACFKRTFGSKLVNQ